MPSLPSKLGSLQSRPHLVLIGPVIFVVFDIFLLISVAALAIAQASQVARNVTTNELANWHRCGAGARSRAGAPPPLAPPGVAGMPAAAQLGNAPPVPAPGCSLSSPLVINCKRSSIHGQLLQYTLLQYTPALISLTRPHTHMQVQVHARPRRRLPQPL